MAGSKWCYVCHASYRGAYILHVATKGHQHKLHPTPPRSWTKGKERGRAARRALAHDEGYDKVTVHRHRRRPPLDGQQKRVKVDTYQRNYAYRPGGISLQAYRRRQRRGY